MTSTPLSIRRTIVPQSPCPLACTVQTSAPASGAEADALCKGSGASSPTAAMLNSIAAAIATEPGVPSEMVRFTK